MSSHGGPDSGGGQFSGNIGGNVRSDQYASSSGRDTTQGPIINNTIQVRECSHDAPTAGAPHSQTRLRLEIPNHERTQYAERFAEKCAELEKQLMEKERQLGEMRDENKRLLAQCHEKDKEIGRLETGRKEDCDEIDRLTKLRDKSSGKMKTMRAQQENLMQYVDNFVVEEREQAQTVRQLDRKRDRKLWEMCEEMRQDAHEDTTAEVSELAGDVQHLKEKDARQQRDIEQLSRTIREVKTERDAALSNYEASEKEKDKLRCELAAALERRAVSLPQTDNLSGLRGELNQLKKRQLDAEGRRATKNEVVQQLTRKTQKLQKSIDAEQGKLASCDDDGDDDDERKIIERSIDEYKAALQKQAEALNTATEEREGIARDIESNEARVRGIEAQIMAIEAEERKHRNGSSTSLLAPVQPELLDQFSAQLRPPPSPPQSPPTSANSDPGLDDSGSTEAPSSSHPSTVGDDNPSDHTVSCLDGCPSDKSSGLSTVPEILDAEACWDAD